jgi:ribose transport system ATP-binding protein
VQLPIHPSQARQLGLAFVHQDLGLVADLTILENLRVGRYETRPGWRIPWSLERRRARKQLMRFGLDVDPDVPVASLSQADRAILAIIRATEHLHGVDQGVLVLDEPTIYLPRDALQKLFGTVRQAAADGHAVLIITHRLDEVFELSDRVTVIRDSRHVATLPTNETDKTGLVELILGRTLGDLYPETAGERGETVLRVAGLTGGGLSDLSFELRRGEILGVTGLIGMGSESLPYLLVGAEDAAGEMEFGEERVDVATLTPGEALRRGIALLPADRPRRGGVGEATGMENLTLPTLGKYMLGGRLRHRNERTSAVNLFEHFDVRPRAPGASFSTFSGGNQQKVVLAKWLETQPALFILHEPTQGVDIGARQQIFAEIELAREQGMAVLIVSVEYEDLAHLCDRVIVMREGRQVAELHEGELTADRIVERCYAA